MHPQNLETFPPVPPPTFLYHPLSLRGDTRMTLEPKSTLDLSRIPSSIPSSSLGNLIR
ncbi:hypothetical protein C1H46_035031 [Malus baccata]|uniref:Uncharacterized protein n=1 Tax=Malus baccata TaxID=106549 RepID=A0A540KYW2_MALBA|nr:hypothetical protein C1H46_035031 [Malus baccata]